MIVKKLKSTEYCDIFGIFYKHRIYSIIFKLTEFLHYNKTVRLEARAPPFTNKTKKNVEQHYCNENKKFIENSIC